MKSFGIDDQSLTPTMSSLYQNAHDLFTTTSSMTYNDDYYYPSFWSDQTANTSWNQSDPIDSFTTSPYPSGYSWTHIIAASVVVTLIMLIIVMGNALVIIAVMVDRNLKGSQNWFIASLAVSDLLVGLFIMPLTLTNELLGFWPFGAVLCQLWLSTDVLLCTASILNLVLISLDRYWSIVRAVVYLRQRTPCRATLMIGAVWTLSAVICFPPLVGWSQPQPVRPDGRSLCVISEETGYVIYSIVGSFYLPLVVMIAVYFKIYQAARWRARRHLTGGAQCAPSPASAATAERAATGQCNDRAPLGVVSGSHRLRLPPSRKRLAVLKTSVRLTTDSRQRQRSSLSTDFDSDMTDRTVPGSSVARWNGDENGNAAVMSTAKSSYDDEVMTVIMAAAANRRHRWELAVDADAKYEEEDDDCSTTPSVFNDVEMSPLKRLCSNSPNAERVDAAHSDKICSKPDYEPCDAKTLTTGNSPTSPVVMVVISSAVDSSTTRVETRLVPSASSLASTTDVDVPRHPRLSSTSSFLTASSTCSPNRIVKNDDRKSLFVAGVKDYGSTKPVSAAFSTISSGIASCRTSSLRPSWNSAGRRRLSGMFRSGSYGGTSTAGRPPCRRGAGAVDGLFADTERAKRKAARARERRATIVLGIVMASFIGCWLPFFAVYPISQLTGVSIPPTVFGVIFWLGYCNSALNPIIYTVFNRDFRKAFQKILFERISRRRSSSSSWL